VQLWDIYPAWSKRYGWYAATPKPQPGKKAEGERGTHTGTPSKALWEAHIQGKGNGLGLFPILDDGESCQWGAIDIDVKPSYRPVVDHAKIAAQLHAMKLPVILTKSKSDGAHIWLFLSEVTPAANMRRLLTALCTALNLPTAGPYATEIFPKHDSRKTGEQGNWINIPYYGGTRRAVAPTGVELSLGDFLDQVKYFRRTYAEVNNVFRSSWDIVMSEGPVCLSALHEAAREESGVERNKFLFEVAHYFIALYGDDWKERMLDYNRHHLNPPLPEEELQQSIFLSKSKKDIGYSCKKSSVCALHCNEAVCRLRPYGIAIDSEQSSKIGKIPFEYGSLFQYRDPRDTAYSRYELIVEGNTIPFENEAQLQDPKMFQQQCFKHSRIAPSRMIKLDVWDAFVRDRFMNKIERDIDPGSSPLGMLETLLFDYFERTNDDLNGIIIDGVYIEAGFAMFVWDNFYKFLRTNNYVHMPKARIYFERLGGLTSKQKFDKSKREYNVCRIPIGDYKPAAPQGQDVHDPAGGA